MSFAWETTPDEFTVWVRKPPVTKWKRPPGDQVEKIMDGLDGSGSSL